MSSLAKNGREVEVRHLFPSTLVGGNGTRVPWTSLAVPSLLVCTVFCSLCLILLAFPCEHAELRKRGLSTARSRDYLERRRSCLTRPAVLCSPACVRKVCHSCFSVREAALSPAAGTGHTGFLAPSGSQTPTFSRVDFTNFLYHIRKGVGQYSPSSLVVLDSVVRQSRGISCLMGTIVYTL